MDYDVIIIGAGMSGLAAGIRLAYFDRRVCILEKHYAYGGLNSYYRLDGRDFDVGLHAVTNFAPRTARQAPLNKLLRQLRLTREDFDLHEQKQSAIVFPDCRLRFSNDFNLLASQVRETFPSQADGFQRLADHIRSFDAFRFDAPYLSTRRVLAGFIRDPLLIDMLLCPVMIYGSAEEEDMDFNAFATLFTSIFLEGFARPREGVRRIIRTLVRTYRRAGGELRMRTGVSSILHERKRAYGVRLDDGRVVTAPVILSSAGYHETLRLCSQTDSADRNEDRRDPGKAAPGPGRLSFVESVCVLSARPADLGLNDTIIFFNDAERFHYRVPDDLIDTASGVVCCPNNYADHDDMPEGIVRLTSLANYDRWKSLAPADYAALKTRCRRDAIARALRFIPDFRPHIVFADTFTPVTIERYTGHIRGAVYGAPRKRRDGRTPIEGLFIIGTDQGYLGIIGALLSGITIANMYVL